ncbi:DEAD/DEAH box helicase [Ketogulonicigenium vulgare]|uniref:DEAD/DEAH box helicase n=1 Tax=Ketogulonicigenium vulgare TaxID=92945 RepID=UPI002359457E|nr:DEAD/DEAH box helicase [Ketogulonicigenium vulgare]
MTHQNIAAPLAAALSQRGYETLTAVQQAVLAPEADGRDLLVSAQTGSGKTVAFGIAVAPDLLGDDNILPLNTPPVALFIAPTRELALQVAQELTWLYANAGAQIATCVGGMDYRTERRALARLPQIVVGTPGRLRDHIDRGGLDLSELRVAVLDEADEMLDLGFRDDLQYILQAAPEDRRTLMFSATVPREIEKLARDFQNDALRLETRGEAKQHNDISYQALSVTMRDRENAIFNMLRFYESRTAIIFCKTRANVNDLLSRMSGRGFRVVALSGELSQQERTNALQALRDGRANVCIATDVAARGIDLPGLELVIHYDLPTNAETLLHRSGRTGRAGAKGVSALIVTPGDFKKAQRLLSFAKVTAEWGKAPSAEEVSARDDLRMVEHPALTTKLDDMTVANDLLARFGAEQISAAFVQLWREGRPAPEALTVVNTPTPGAAPAPREPRTSPREFGASVWFSLSAGHVDRAEARWLLPKICDAGGITRDAIGAIRVRESETFVQIAANEAGRFANVSEIEPGLTLTQIDGEPNLEQRSSGPKKFGAGKPGKFAKGGESWGDKKQTGWVERKNDGWDDKPAPKKHRKGEFEAGMADAPAAAPRKPRFDDAPAATKTARIKPRWTEEQPSFKAKRPSAAGAPAKPRDGAKPAFKGKPYAANTTGGAPRKSKFKA